MTWLTVQIPDIFDHKHAFLVWYSDHHLNTDYLTTGHKSTIWILDLSGLLTVAVYLLALASEYWALFPSMKSIPWMSWFNSPQLYSSFNFKSVSRLWYRTKPRHKRERIKVKQDGRKKVTKKQLKFSLKVQFIPGFCREMLLKFPIK